jgi:hypothetical protein
VVELRDGLELRVLLRVLDPEEPLRDGLLVRVLLRDELELRLGEEYVFLGVLLRVLDELLRDGLELLLGEV